LVTYLGIPFWNRKGITMTADRLLVVLCGLMILITSGVLAETSFGSPTHGQSLYQQHCLRCHGGRLDGNGPDADSLRVRPTNLHTYLMLDRGPSELEDTIRQGRTLTPMHAWGTVLTDQDISDLVAFIRREVPQIEMKP
jgi:mono/diheme cytochrome c family protein